MFHEPSIGERLGWLVSEGFRFRERLFELGIDHPSAELRRAVELVDLVRQAELRDEEEAAVCERAEAMQRLARKTT